VTASPAVITLVADGARPDTLDAAMRDGTLPALARLRDEGGAATLTTVFPSVTGPAYTPFLMGRHPGTVGIPGLRWFDRSRQRCRWPSYARSYVGPGMRHVDGDLEGGAPTLFELAPSAIGALSVITRGLSSGARLERGTRFAVRAARTHFRGDVRGWLAIDRDVGDRLVPRIVRDRPAYVFAAFTGIDKVSHATGHASPMVCEAMRIVDDVVAQIRAALERDGRWNATHLHVVSDHGHSPVAQHDDLADVVEAMGYAPLAHPLRLIPGADVAVMVSGNAMAHLYVELQRRTRPFWGALRERWSPLADALLARPSVDLIIVPQDTHACEVCARGRGSARVTWHRSRYTYRPLDGDPLALGALEELDATAAHEATRDSDYPDALVQIARLAECHRSGDLILSAARGWDFRARYEPIPHVSAHGALHREHMCVPIVANRPLPGSLRRTVDVMPLCRDALFCRTDALSSSPYGAALADPVARP